MTLQLFLFTILPLTLLLVLIVIGSLSLHHTSMRSLVGDRDLRAVRAAAHSLSSEIEHRALALQLFAQQIGAAQNTTALLESTSLPGFEGGLALVSDSGQVLAGGIQAAPDFSSRLPPPSSSVVFSQPFQNDLERWLVLAAVPVPGGDRLIGAFSPSDLARSALSGVATPQTTVLLLSQHSEILYQVGEFSPDLPMNDHPGVNEVLRGESGVNYSDHAAGSPFTLWPDQQSEHLTAFSPVPPLGWGLILEESWGEIASPLLTWTQSAPLILVPILILAMLALWFGVRQVEEPLRALERRASGLASGDFSSIRTPVGGISEIRHLQGALINMARELQAAQESLHGYIGALTSGVENERRSLARELHDETLQALIALNQRVQFALLQAQEPHLRQQLHDLQGQVRQIILDLRRAIGGLRPIYLEDLGLEAALGMLVKEIPSAAPTDAHPHPSVTFKVSGVERRLPSETELVFYRIAQEALNNAINHARAANIDIRLDFETIEEAHTTGVPHQGIITLSICDDGEGFPVSADPSAYARFGHYGLLGMRERADLVGASLKIDSAPGQGTKVIVQCTWQTG